MPSLYVIAGPNGAGKTTFIKRFAPREIAVLDFLNADEVARGLSPLAPERAQFEAGRIVLSRFAQFVSDRRNFCLETTLSGRTYRKLFAAARAAGYHVRLDFLLLPEVEDSIRRVADRVEQGGHDVPLDDLRRRFRVGVQNLFSIYRPVLDAWSLYDNGQHAPVLLAYGTPNEITVVAEAAFQKVVTDFNLRT
jgi:predicted ABC-type ATPase